MLDGITTSGASAGAGKVAPVGASSAARAATPPAATGTAIPPFPPPQVLADVQRAASALTDMAAKQIELTFTVDGLNRLQVQVRDNTGRLVREIPASRAIDLLTGADGAVVDNYG